jgi:hypothetical protein
MVGKGVAGVRHSNTFFRVSPRELMKAQQDLEYDKEKYCEILLEAAETLLGYFGFVQSDYGDFPKRNLEEVGSTKGAAAKRH